MTPLAFLLVLISETCEGAGQIFFKHAMSGKNGIRKGTLTAGVAAKAVAFFLWIGLMSKVDLSYLYPFDGLNRILLVIAAWIFLKEKMTLNLWVGVVLISAGVLLVSRSGG
jgi:undecaprenyl phosphate-alpha-L-ara4N flippase subunit ArnE